MAKGCTTNNYEGARKQRLEENQPCLPKLAQKTDGVVEPRRSSRARNPVSSYREDVSNIRSRSRQSSWESYVVRPLDEIKVATEGKRIRALEAAEALQMNLKTSHPSFVKSMVRSHVYSCFWLGLPSKFCKEHLPKTLNDMILEDENDSKYEAVYIGKRSGLSGGWRAFALDHKLDDGDALVFELIEAAKFKVYIVRAFPNSVEKEDTLEEEGTMRGKKAASNGESESKKSKKPKQAIVHEHKEPVNRKNFKEEGKTPATKATKR
ncbi:putative B3 domain-containing protein At5g58280 [Lotus japonicus]|uniref:putative B3 domain-containing protein At5g58280 n=1 Tax=Lotus japonicus TaxID=34305 RepID=UPI002588592D|nr:putative B3 domain-containing protein At5g58280 [Lotus japonicus]